VTGLDDLRLSWTALAAGPEPEGGEGHHMATLPLPERAGGSSILLGRDLDDRRHLLVPTADAEVTEDTSSDAVQILELELGTGPKRLRYADVVCRMPRLAEVFDDLILAILRTIGPDAAEAPEVCSRTLEDWRAMLRPPAREPLSVRQTAGLVAELHTAIELVRDDPERRIDVWTGPTGARHDFRRGDRALEVKASLSQGEATTEIHGIEQLAAPEGGTLHLVWMRLEQVPDGRVSVALLVERLRKLIGGSPALYLRLTEAGWRPEAAAEQLTFEIRERRVYRVEEPFPRLHPANLVAGAAPAGVRNVRYEIALDHASPLTGGAVGQLFAELAVEHTGG